MKQHTTTKTATTTLTICTAMAVDLAKRVFQIAAEDAHGKVNLLPANGRQEAWGQAACLSFLV